MTILEVRIRSRLRPMVGSFRKGFFDVRLVLINGYSHYQPGEVFNLAYHSGFVRQRFVYAKLVIFLAFFA